MYDIEDIFEIDLTKGGDFGEIINDAIAELDLMSKKNPAVKLKLGDIQINQSQMVFINSLVEGLGGKLTFVETTNEITRDICLGMDINATNANFASNSVIVDDKMLELQNSKLDDLRLEFKQGFENKDAATEQNNEDKINAPSSLEQDSIVPKREVFIDDAPQETRQVIGIYRKADEEENRLEFEEENAEFYTTPTDEPVVVDTKDTIYVHQTLRCGQSLVFDGNVVIIGDCHPGSEIKATGDITVWGVLGSVAHAGIKGNSEAKIRALKMNAVQLRIANCYSRRPDGGNIPYIGKTSVFTPEEARIVNDNIVLFKMAQD